MGQPQLIEPIKVEIEQIDKDNTPYSTGVNGMNEHINHIAKKTKFEIDAQVVFGNTEQKTEFSQLGAKENVKGYMVLRYIDLQNLGKTLERGDRITKLGQFNVKYFLLHSTGDSAAHYSSLDFTLVRMFFDDRNPGND